MKWFGKKSLDAQATGEGRRPALSAAGSLAALGSWPTSYEAQVRDAAIQARLAELEAAGGVTRPEPGAIDPAVLADPSLLAD